MIGRFVLRGYMLCFCLLIIIALFIGTISAPYGYYCLNTTYTATGTYGQFLESLLSDLSSDGYGNGFYNSSAGDDYDGSGNTVYGLFMCRGDVSITDCQTCVDGASTEILRLCWPPNQMAVVAWYDYCMLRYSNSSMLGRADQSPVIHFRNTQNDSQPASFMDAVGNTLNQLATRSSRSPKKFATLQAKYTANETIYSLGQCTPYLSDSDCHSCLTAAIQQLSRCCYSSLGARTYSTSCNIRYEVYSFYNSIADPAPPPAPLPIRPPPPVPFRPPPPPPPTGEGKPFLEIVIDGIYVN
ncbi:putative cysteine-rich receptor-like protein kinase 9 [Ipomoea triloba]|uniref:putative cysteine-rich receptor-like protein kinase 9 n=1 Tax=Ipomoea triloba TaxID=35885 RepID=UPI00125DBAFD|nr:putative cysteine-rich receptor-like protein kinase 9 [Ipomoea triloba]